MIQALTAIFNVDYILLNIYLIFVVYLSDVVPSHSCCSWAKGLYMLVSLLDLSAVLFEYHFDT